MNAETQTAPGSGNKGTGYAPIPREERIEGKLNGDILTSIILETEARGSGAMFKIENGAQLWEIAKMMSLSGPAVAPPLRGKPYLCFAVAQQAQRWRMDPFAVGSKAYVTTSKDKETGELIEHIAYEAQLVNAVINTNAPIKHRPDLSWEGIGDIMKCTVSATFSDEDKPKSLTSPTVAGIYPKNSPLWKTAPNIQLGYWTQRAWARLYCPEVLLGVYTPDEMEAEAALISTTSTPAPPRPQRADFDLAKTGHEDLDHKFAETMRDPATHNYETGELTEQTKSAASDPSAPMADAGHGGAKKPEAEDNPSPTPTTPAEAVTAGVPAQAEPQQAKTAAPKPQPAPKTTGLNLEPETTTEAVYRNLLKLLGNCETRKAVDTLLATDKRVKALQANEADLYDIFQIRVKEKLAKIEKAGK